jgi:spoIIIJ-associated protein
MNGSEQVETFLGGVIKAARWRLNMTVSESAEGLQVDFSGEDEAVLLAHHAEVMRALEYLANRSFERAGLKISLDCNHYRQEREAELVMMAQVAAERVKEQGRPHAFSPMAPDERRILHLAVAGDPAIRTESEGYGEHRKVVMYPK